MALTAKKALGAAKKFTKDTVVGLGAIKGANLVVESIVYNDVDMRTEVNVSWTGTDGSSQTGVANLPYGVGIKSVRLDDTEENFIFTNTDDVDLDPVPIPKVQVKISKEEGNALVQKNDGIYVGETGVKVSQEAGNSLVEKSDGLFVQGVSVSKEANNKLEEKADGLYVSETALSAELDNLLERKNDGLYVPSLEVSVSNLSDANKLLGIKLSDKVDKQVIIPCKTTVLSANVQKFDSSESVNLYKYTADGVSIYAQSLIDTTSNGVVVYDSNLRRFGNVKVNDDGLTFTLTGRESEFTFNINPSLVAEAVKLHDDGFNIVLHEANEDYGVYININNIGLDTRLALDLSNINNTGIEKIKEYAETDNKVDIQQKAEDAGKALVVGADGRLIPTKIVDNTMKGNIIDNWEGTGVNLIPFPYFRKSGFVNEGVTYTYSDEWVTAIRPQDSENTKDSYFSFSPVYEDFEEGKYALILDGDIDTSIEFRLGIDRRKSVYPYDYINRYVTGKRNSKIVFFEYNDKADNVSPQCWISFINGKTPINATFRAMLVKVNEDGSYITEYQRYALGNVKLTNELSNKADIQRVSDNWGTGSYNLIRFPYASDNTLVSNGVTFTTNEDGSVHVEGTATDIVYYAFASQTNSYLSLSLNKLYRLSCNIKSELELTSDAVAQFYYIDSEFDSSWRIVNINAEGDKYIDFSKTTESNDGGVLIRVLAGKTVNFTIKPMLYELNAPNNRVLPYQRYASSNVELTDKLGRTNSEIDTLKYDSKSGGLNLLDLSKRGSITNFRKNSEGYLTNISVDEGRNYFDLTIQSYTDSGIITLSNVSLNSTTMSATIDFTVQDEYKNILIKHNGAKTDLVIVSNTLANLGIESNKPYTLTIKCSKIDPQSVEGIVITELAIFEGQEPHAYVPYIPSVNMLYNLVAGLKVKSIECSNGGHHVVYFQVGNLVIGSLISYGMLVYIWNQDSNILEEGRLPRLVGTSASFVLNGGDNIDTSRCIYILPDGSLHVNKDIPQTTTYGYNAIFMYKTDEYI